MSEKTLSRREFLSRSVVLGLALSGTAAVLQVGCKSGGGSETGEGGEGGGGGGDSLSCTDTTGLTEEQVTIRTALQYVEASGEQDKTCSNCVLFTAGGGCGTCSVVAGPINPNGYCVSWGPAT